MRPFIKLIRPHQWLKNGFVWVGYLFAGNWTLGPFVHVAAGFVAFCLAASSVYVFNDIQDVEADRAHPTKRNRPIANNTVRMPMAWGLTAALAMVALGIALWLGNLAIIVILAYLLTNIAYSYGLKHVVILDVFIISSGFMLRILMGTSAVEIPPSQWLLLTGLMVTLFLGFAKRRSELLLLENTDTLDRASMRRVLDDYSPIVLDQLTAVTAAGTIICYSMYTISPVTLAVHNHSNLFATVPIVMYGMFRYLFLLHHEARGGDTSRDLLSDRHLIMTALAWGAVTIAILR